MPYLTCALFWPGLCQEASHSTTGVFGKPCKLFPRCCNYFTGRNIFSSDPAVPRTCTVHPIFPSDQLPHFLTIRNMQSHTILLANLEAGPRKEASQVLPLGPPTSPSSGGTDASLFLTWQYPGSDNAMQMGLRMHVPQVSMSVDGSTMPVAERPPPMKVSLVIHLLGEVQKETDLTESWGKALVQRTPLTNCILQTLGTFASSTQAHQESLYTRKYIID